MKEKKTINNLKRKQKKGNRIPNTKKRRGAQPQEIKYFEKIEKKHPFFLN
jgi:hypothetical protein